MGTSFQRPMESPALAKHFLVNVLGLSDADHATETLAFKISALETIELHRRNSSTLLSTVNRSASCQSDDQRAELRQKVIADLLTLERPPNDDDITPDAGGAMPRTAIKARSTAWLVIGPPAAGKSKICCALADQTGSLILDSDYAKRKLPEFQNGEGASLVHDESSALIFGGKGSGAHTPGIEPNLTKQAIGRRYNLVIPRVGETVEGIRELRDILHEQGYAVHLVLIALDRTKAAHRALNRYRSPNPRYVPLSLVFDHVSNNPAVTYFKLRLDASSDPNASHWRSFLAYDNDVPLGTPPRLFDEFGKAVRISFAPEPAPLTVVTKVKAPATPKQRGSSKPGSSRGRKL